AQRLGVQRHGDLSTRPRHHAPGEGIAIVPRRSLTRHPTAQPNSPAVSTLGGTQGGQSQHTGAAAQHGGGRTHLCPILISITLPGEEDYPMQAKAAISRAPDWRAAL